MCCVQMIDSVTGTGLLVAAHLNKKFPVVGVDQVEWKCRQAGLGVIHGGTNALRFTPYFYINEVNISTRIV